MWIGFFGYRFIKNDLPAITSDIAHELVEIYPSKLQLTLANGILSSNQTEPLTYTPRALAGILAQYGWEHLVVLDPLTEQQSADDCKCVIYGGRAGITIFSGEHSEKRSYAQLGFVPEKQFTFVKKDADDLVGKLKPYVLAAPQSATYILIGIALLTIMTGPVFSLIGWLITLLIWSLFGWLVSRIINRPITYRRTYALGMYAITPIILISALEWITGTAFMSGYTAILTYVLMMALFIPQHGNHQHSTHSHPFTP
jgi:hypothetical protein